MQRKKIEKNMCTMSPSTPYNSLQSARFCPMNKTKSQRTYIHVSTHHLNPKALLPTTLHPQNSPRPPMHAPRHPFPQPPETVVLGNGACGPLPRASS